MYVVLGGYQYNALLDFREVYDFTGEYYHISNFLNGRGVSSVDTAKYELHLSGVHNFIAETSLFLTVLRNLICLLTSDEINEPEISKMYSEISGDVYYFINELNHIKHLPLDNKKLLDMVEEDIKATKLFISAVKGFDSLKKETRVV